MFWVNEGLYKVKGLIEKLTHLLTKDETKMKRISVDLENGVFKDFSKQCIDVDKSKVEVIRGLITNWLKESVQTVDQPKQ